MLGAKKSLKIAVVSPELQLANVRFNRQVILSTLQNLNARSCQIVVFPELSLTGATCGDLYLHKIIQNRALEALGEISDFLKSYEMLVCVGLPMKFGENLYNGAVLINQDGIQGITVKSALESGKIREERRWFSTSAALQKGTVELFGSLVQIGEEFDLQCGAESLITVAVQIGEDSEEKPLKSPTLLLNPCAEVAWIGKNDTKKARLAQFSLENDCIIASASSGPNESTTDHVYSGQSLIVANGQLLGETSCFDFSTQTVMAEIKLKDVTPVCSEMADDPSKRKPVERVSESSQIKEFYPMTLTPFVPTEIEQQDQASQSAFQIQVTGLARRLRATGSQNVVLGLSGGMDSSLAFLVCVHAFEKLNLPTSGIHVVFMPGPGTSQLSRNNCQQLASQFEVTFREIAIHDALYAHLRDIGHPGNVFGLTFENAQARERTQILMDLAGLVGGFVVGTGDMSELALGWCTYNADQMSMYNMNAGIPKTFIQAQLAWYARSYQDKPIASVLQAIIAAPISPELQPLSTDGTSPQQTEQQIGPYLLHDFFLFHTLRDGLAPEELFNISSDVFKPLYTPTEILKWMRVFYRRFITQQYKRSAMPDGPSVFSIGLSPRTALAMPSDASPALWLEALDELEKTIRSSQAGDYL